MQVNVNEAIEVFDKFKVDEIPLIFLTDIRYQAPESRPILLKRGNAFNSEIGNALLNAGIKHVDLIFNDKLLNALNKLFPIKYRIPYGQYSFFQLDKMINVFKEINRKSNRERTIISLTEIYKREGNRVSVLIEYGEHLEFTKWNEIKTKIDKRRMFDFRYSENGIIVFVDLRPSGDNYLQRFYKNSDLVTSLVGRKQDETINISPDFIREADVVTVDDPGKLLEIYKKQNSRLIIVGDTLSQDYKNALAHVKSYDKYARFMMATNIDQNDIHNFLVSVQKNYKIDNFNIDDF